MLKLLRGLTLFRLLAIAKMVLIARRHYRKLETRDRRRLAALVRRGMAINAAEREELLQILAKLEPRAFALAVTGAFAPGKMPRWLASRLER
jgi:hypothetical protein